MSSTSWIFLGVALVVGLGALAVAAKLYLPLGWRALRRRLLDHLALAAGRGLPLGPAVVALAEERRRGSLAAAVVHTLLGGSPRAARKEAAALERVAGAIDATGSLAGALEATKELRVPAERLALLRAAEGRGALPEVLAQLADEHAALDDARSALVVAGVYPLIMTIIVGGVAVFMTFFIEPRFREIFANMRVDPGLAYDLWEQAADAGPLFGAFLVGLGMLAWSLWQAAGGALRRGVDRTPLLGPPLRRLQAGLTLQRVSALLRAGSTLPEALDDAAPAAVGIGAAAAREAAALARAGRPPLEALERLLGPDVAELAARLALEVERAPSFPDGVRAAGRRLAASARERLARLVVLFRPVPVIACALIVAAMHFAVWIPILRMQSYCVEGI